MKSNLIAAMCAVLLVGCASSFEYHDYRVVPKATAMAHSDEAVFPATLGVFPVQVPGWLDKRAIVWGSGGVRIDRAAGQQWGEPLPQLLTQAIVQNFQRLSGEQSWVTAGPWSIKQRPELVAKVNVQELSIRDNQLIVRVDWQWASGERGIVTRNTKTYSQPLGKKGDPAVRFVEALSGLWSTVAYDMAEALRNASSFKN